MITGVEIDMVVSDSLEALALYEKIFPVERLEVTELETGSNEAVFMIFNSRFHLLDENHKYQLFAPKPGDAKPMWMNVAVADIADTFEKAMEAGCQEIQPPTKMEGFGVTNAMFSCPFGYVWMLHQIHREVGFEERMKQFESEEK